jgi:uncharacterized membrane protein YeaQ/YmgE (transglycosylase-associated protein family)
MLILLVVIVAIILLFVIAVLAVGLVLKLLWWAIIGLVLGAIARAILPGDQKIGLLRTAGAGVAAALLGGIIGHILGVGNFLQFVVAVIVAVVIVGVLSSYEASHA